MIGQSKQSWYLVGGAVILAALLGISIYLIGVSRGKAQAGVDFNKRQADLLLKSQLAVAEADKQKQIADAATAYATQLQTLAQQSTDKARATEARITKIYEEEQKQIRGAYEKDIDSINSGMSDCARCRDLCQRSNALTAYGPEFKSAACNADTACAAICSTEPAQ